MRILLADDDERMRRSIRTLLSAETEISMCEDATDGVEAVEKAKSLRPDLLLMDISMPRMDGLVAARILRRDLPETKIIIISQTDPVIGSQHALEVGASAFVDKGDLFRQLLPAISRLSNSHTEKRATDKAPSVAPARTADWLDGGGSLGRMIREYEWSQTPLGPLEKWPQSLKTSVNLILNSRHPMWIGWGPEATFLYNDAYIPVLSLAKHPWVLGKPTAEVWPEIWDTIGPLIDKVYGKGEASFVDEVRLLMNRGEFIEETYYSFSYSPIRDESGAVSGLFCPSTDVSSTVINARRLRTLSELSAHALVQKTTDAACASSAETLAKNPDDIPFAILYLLNDDNTRADLQKTCVLSLGIAGLTPPSVDLSCENLQTCAWPLAEVVKTGQAQIFPVRNLAGLPLGIAQQPISQVMVLPVSSRGDGGTLGILVAGVSPARNLDSEYRTFYELIAGQIATAIRNARAAEEERQRLEALAEIDRAKTTFFSNVSHEFRTPLTLMLGPLQDLLSRSQTHLSPIAKEQLELVNRNGARLLRLVNTLLDFSRIEAGRVQGVYQATDLAGFTSELASVFRSATDRAGLRLIVDCRAIGEPVYVDRDMWEKIVLNLVSNAFKFTFDGEIAVSLDRVGDAAELRVRDTGVGIPAEAIPTLFERFHRVPNTRSRTFEGSGIGLALVHELVKLHSGFIRVESAVGEGSTFIVSVPLGQDHLASQQLGGSRSLASTAVGGKPYLEEALRWLPDVKVPAMEGLPPQEELMPVPCPPIAGDSTARRRILVADDNSDMRQYLVRLLAEHYEVEAVADGQAALESVRQRPPDLVLTDVMMPNVDGFALLGELRSDPATRTIPIILLSARAGEESRIEGVEHGADDYLIKPFSARELLARVQTHLEMARIRKESEEALRRRTEQFETLLNEAPLAVYLLDGDFRIRALNPSARRAFGSIHDAVGRVLSEVIHRIWSAAYADEMAEQIRQTLETGKPHSVAERVADRLDCNATEIYEWQINRIQLPEGGYGVVCYFRDITRQVNFRDRIAESEQRLRLASEAAELGIGYWYVNEDKIEWHNERAYEIFGRTHEDRQFNVAEFREKICHPDDLPEFERLLVETLQTGKRFFFVGRAYRPDGACIWLEITAIVEYLADGSPFRLLGTIADVTERKQAEDALLANRRRFELVAEGAQVGFWFCDLPFDKLIWDHRTKEHFWLLPDAEVTIETFYERLHPDDRERTRQAIAESNTNHTPYDIEYRTVALDGRRKWIRALGNTFYDAAGQPIRFDGLTLDVTERKLIEEREREVRDEAVAATAKFRAVFEQTSVFAGIMALDGTVLDANQLSLDACGYRAEEVLGRPFWEISWWRLSSTVQSKIRKATLEAAKGIPYREILPYHWADGSARIVDFSLHPIRDDQGRILFLHPTGVDITDLKRAEEKYRNLAEGLDAEVRVRTKELVRQSEQLSDLSSRLLQVQDEERRHIARELHDSAGQILTVLSIQLSQAAQQAPKRNLLLAKQLKESEQLVEQLSQEIRTMSYLLHPPLLDETGLLGAIRWYIDGLKERSGLAIALEAATDFERLPREIELVMFRLVQECLTNIHRHSGSATALIQIARDGDSISLEIQDEGKGIPAGKLSDIQASGCGVGIRGMRERMHSVGGQMRIESNQHGTRVCFNVPVSRLDGLTRHNGVHAG